MDLGLKDKVAIVTGAANGIGKAICSALCAEGAHVLIADVDGGQAELTAKALRDNGNNVLACAVDVTNEEAVESMVKLAVEQFGTVHILVNNAGFTRDMRITKMATNDWNAVIDVVLKGAFLCTKAVIPYFTEQKFGRVINISSRAHLGNPGQANYSAAKAGLIGFTRSMALENGRNFITANAVAPGIIDTEAVRRLPHYAKVRVAAEKTTPIPRIGEPEDVANAVSFLASEQAGYISGEVLHVTGGRY